MGIADAIRDKKRAKENLRLLQNEQTPTFIPPASQPNYPTDYKPTTTRTAVTDDQWWDWNDKVNGKDANKRYTYEEIQEAKRQLGLTTGAAGGGHEQVAVFEDPNYAGQTFPSFRDLITEKATGAVNQEGVSNPLNYMRTGQTIDTSGVDYLQMLGLADRGSQEAALGLQRDAAMGLAPSVAQIQQQQGLDSALSSQFALANSARGGAAQRAAAQGTAAQQAGQLQQAGVNQASALRAAEMATARGAYGDLAGAMRAGDLGQGQLTRDMTIEQARLLQEQELANQQGIISQQGLDLSNKLGLIGASQGADAMALGAQEDAAQRYLQLLGLKTGVSQNTPSGRGAQIAGETAKSAAQLALMFI